MPNLEERIESVKIYVKSLDGKLPDAVTFLSNFQALHQEVLLSYGPGDILYHEAQALLHTVLSWVTTEYGLLPESELLFGSARYHLLKAGEAR